MNNRTSEEQEYTVKIYFVDADGFSLDYTYAVSSKDVPATHPLKGSRKGEWGMTVTKNWRITLGVALRKLPGPVQTIRDASPKAQHHFTHADQGEWLCAPNASPKLLWDG